MYYTMLNPFFVYYIINHLILQYAHMLRYFCLTLLTCLNLTSFAQSYIGFGADNFNGVHGILTNPANIADSRSRIDINLVSASQFTTNSYLELEYFNLITKDTGDFEAQSNRLGIDKVNFGVLDTDVLGPSAMVSLSDKHSVALSTRARSFININNIDGEVIRFLEEEDTDDIDEIGPISDINASAVVNNWIEYGATYARVLNDNKIHFLKGGVTLKYITGYGAAQASLNDVLIYYDRARVDPDNVLLRGEASYTYSKNFDSNEDFEAFGGDDEYEFKSDARGLGLDLGIVYEYRPKHRQNVSRNNVKEQVIIRHKSTYKYKIGFSIMDIGRLTYKQSLVSSADLGTINIETLLDGDFEDEVKPALGVVNSRVDQEYWLPTTIRGEFDLKLKDKFYLNATTRLSVFSKENENASRYANQVTVSPRYETKWFTAFSPITYTQFGGMQWGLGGRLGPIFIGSSSAISHLIIDNQTRVFDFYAGIKIPIFHKTPPPPPEDDPTSGYRSDCDGCIQKEEKQPTKALRGYSEAR